MNYVALICLLSAANFAEGRVSTPEEVARQEKATIVSRTTVRRFRFPFAVDTEETCNPNEMSCSDNRLTFCSFDNIKTSVSCSAVFDGKPGYCDCDNIGCVPTPPNCSRPDTTSCSQVGEKLPDPKDCHQFTYCDGTTRVTIRCPTGLAYNPATSSCAVQTSCDSLSCNPRKIIEWIAFPQAPEYYLFCNGGFGEVRKCTIPQYTMQNNKCQFQCQKAGTFKDPYEENCKKGLWHSCIPNKGSFTRYTNRCGKSGGKQKYFNEKAGLCLLEDTCSNGESTSDPSVTTPSTQNTIS